MHYGKSDPLSSRLHEGQKSMPLGGILDALVSPEQSHAFPVEVQGGVAVAHITTNGHDRVRRLVQHGLWHLKGFGDALQKLARPSCAGRSRIADSITLA